MLARWKILGVLDDWRRRPLLEADFGVGTDVAEEIDVRLCSFDREGGGLLGCGVEVGDCEGCHGFFSLEVFNNAQSYL